MLDDADQYADTLTEDENPPHQLKKGTAKDEPTNKPATNKSNTNNGSTNQLTVNKSRHRRTQRHHQWKVKAFKKSPGGKTAAGKLNKPEENEGMLPKFVSNHTHYSTTDPDARVSTKPGKPRQLNCLGQVCVDTANHVITNIEAHTADKRDSQCLPSVLQNTIDNLQEEGLTVAEILADTGYSSGEALNALEANIVTGYIPNMGTYKPVKEGFTYDADNDSYVCRQSAVLPFKKLATTSIGHQVNVYSSSAKDCTHCP